MLLQPFLLMEVASWCQLPSSCRHNMPLTILASPDSPFCLYPNSWAVDRQQVWFVWGLASFLFFLCSDGDVYDQWLRGQELTSPPFGESFSDDWISRGKDMQHTSQLLCKQCFCLDVKEIRSKEKYVHCCDIKSKNDSSQLQGAIPRQAAWWACPEWSTQRPQRGEGTLWPKSTVGSDVFCPVKASESHAGRCLGPAAWLGEVGLVDGHVLERPGSAHVPQQFSCQHCPQAVTSCASWMQTKMENLQTGQIPLRHFMPMWCSQPSAHRIVLAELGPRMKREPWALGRHVLKPRWDLLSQWQVDGKMGCSAVYYRYLK